MTRFKVIILLNIASFAQISLKQVLKYTIFFNTKNLKKKMAKSFYFCHTVSKKVKFG